VEKNAVVHTALINVKKHTNKKIKKHETINWNTYNQSCRLA